MKGIRGLIVAIGLGITGALLNLIYLTSKSEDLDTVEYIGVNSDVTIPRGTTILRQHLVPVKVPQKLARNLEKFAIRYSDISGVAGWRAVRTLEGGSFVWRDDLRTPPAELDFSQNLKPGEEELAWGIPIDSRSIVSALIEPGNEVSFLAPRPPAESPTLAPPGAIPGAVAVPGGAAGSGGGSDEVERVGPFRVLSVGSRVGRRDVFQAAGLPTAQENVLVVAIRLNNGKLEEKGAKLQRLLQAASFRPLSVLLHAPSTKKE